MERIIKLIIYKVIENSGKAISIFHIFKKKKKIPLDLLIKRSLILVLALIETWRRLGS